MPRFNPNDYDSSKVSNYETPKPGIYLIKAIDAEVKTSSNENEYWKMQYEIMNQESDFYKQRLFDNIVFAEKIMNRVKLIFEAFGVDMEQEREFITDDLIGGIAKVQVTHIESYKKKDGTFGEKAVIGFDGYFPAEARDVTKVASADEDIPF